MERCTLHVAVLSGRTADVSDLSPKTTVREVRRAAEARGSLGRSSGLELLLRRVPEGSGAVGDTTWAYVLLSTRKDRSSSCPQEGTVSCSV